MFSAEEIRNATFTRRGKGYECEQVDNFLDKVYSEYAALEDRLAEAEAEAAAARKNESALAQILIAAENSANDIRSKAQQDAERMLADARTRADSVIAESDAKAQRYAEDCEREHADIVEEVEQIKNFRDDYVAAILADMDEIKASFIRKFEKDAKYDSRPQPAVFAEPEEPAEEPAAEEPAGEIAAEAAELAEPAEDAPAEPEETPEILRQNGEFDVNDILKDLPESEAELKKMIDELL